MQLRNTEHTYVMATSRPVAAMASSAAWTPPAPLASKWAWVPIPSMTLPPWFTRLTRATSPRTLALLLSRLQRQIFSQGTATIAQGYRGNALVVVDVELASRVGAARMLERDADEALAHDAAEYGLTEGTVLVEDFVYDVPVEDLAREAAHDTGDVVLDDLGLLG